MSRLIFINVATPQFFISEMAKSKTGFAEPDSPVIIVSELTKQTVWNAIDVYINEEDDGYWVKLYHVSATLEIEDLDKIIDRKIQKSRELQKEE